MLFTTILLLTKYEGKIIALHLKQLYINKARGFFVITGSIITGGFIVFSGAVLLMFAAIVDFAKKINRFIVKSIKRRRSNRVKPKRRFRIYTAANGLKRFRRKA